MSFIASAAGISTALIKYLDNRQTVGSNAVGRNDATSGSRYKEITTQVPYPHQLQVSPVNAAPFGLYTLDLAGTFYNGTEDTSQFGETGDLFDFARLDAYYKQQARETGTSTYQNNYDLAPAFIDEGEPEPAEDRYDFFA